ncbi:MAG: hypothetical protein R3C69_11595 [Geminicoccaceae bacterium]
MIFTQGGNTGGWAFYLKDGVLGRRTTSSMSRSTPSRAPTRCQPARTS